MSYPAFLSFPFRIGPGGRSALVPGLPEHVRDEIVQLILTAIGERLFLPEFGTNVKRMVFENVDETVVGLTKATLSHALAQWLGHRATVDRLEVGFANGQLAVDLDYRVIGDASPRQMRFERQVG